MAGAPVAQRYGSPGEEAVWPDGSPALDPYEPLDGRARAATILLGLAAVLAVVSGVLSIEQANAIDTFLDSGDIEPLERSDDHFAVLALPQAIVSIATIVVFLVWFHRAYKNLPALGIRRLRYTSGWAVGAWFVPFLNLVRPKAIANDLWKASDPDLPGETADWRSNAVSGLVHWWWAVYLLSIITVTITIGEIDTLDRQDAGNSRIDAARSVLSVVAAVLAIKVVGGITERQRQRAERAGAA
jgi:hypothetical protein